MDMSPADVAGAPGLSLGFSLVTRIYEANKNVKCTARCNHVAAQCRELLVTLEDSLEGLEGERVRAIGDEIEGLLRRVEQKAVEWSSYSYLKSFLLQGDIQEGLLELDRRIDTIGRKFQIQTSMVTARLQKELREAQKRDEILRRDLLARIVEDVEDIKKLVNLESNTNPVVETVMHSLQEELREPDLRPEQEETFKNGLWMLHKSTQKLPPLTDLTGQIETESKHRVAAGTHNDIYTGKWLNKEKVALRLPRFIPEDTKVQKRFERDLTIWRKLDHSNVVPLYGIYYEGKDIYSVSPWMDNGTVLDYLGRCPEANRLDIIHQIATGLEYLHNEGIIHGDLRAGNVLVNKDCIACISDFGMSKVLEDVGPSSTTSPGHNPRWCAPELLETNAAASKMTDVWSFAMVCLEIMTERPPFKEIKNDVAIIRQLLADKHPQRPEPNFYISDNLWLLLEKCWQKKPYSRPTISEIVQQIDQLRRLPRILTASSSLMANRLNNLGFRRLRTKQSSTSSVDSSQVSAEPRVRPAHPVFEEPEPISPSALYFTAQSPKEPPRLEVTFEDNKEVDWDLEGHISTSIPNTQPHSLSPYTSPNCLPLELPSPMSVRTSDSSSQYSTSTRAAVTDPNVIIHLRRDGSVVSGTLEGLVVRLINSHALHRDEEFRDILLSCTVDFVPAEDFFSVIERHFNEAGSSEAGPCSQDRVQKQSSILAILLYWVKTPHLPLDSLLIWQMKRFCVHARSLLNSEFLQKKTDDILDALNKDVRSASLPAVVQGPPLKGSAMSPSGLAIGLTLMENDKFKQIYPSDYLLYFNQELPGQTNAVEPAKEANLKIVKWTQQTVLHFDDVLQRAEVMKFLLHTSNECLSLGNLSSAAAISVAFSSKLIDDLSYTKDQLEQSLKVILRDLRELISEDRRRYRELLDERLTMEPHHGRIPWLAIHLSDISELLNHHPVTCEANGRRLINFDRYTRFRGYLQDHIPSPPTTSGYADLEQHRHSGQLAYVNSKLKDIKLYDREFDAMLEKRANEIKAAEQRAKNRRVVETKKLGFREKRMR